MPQSPLLVFSELRVDYWQERVSCTWTDGLSGGDSYCWCLWSDLSEPLSCLSACCFVSVWCSAGLREDQALPELALPFSPCNRSSTNTSNTAPLPTFLPLRTHELFLSKNVRSLLDHQRRLTEQQCPSRVSRTIKENKKRQSDLIPS